jgi:hypothetical protein
VRLRPERQDVPAEKATRWEKDSWSRSERHLVSWVIFVRLAPLLPHAPLLLSQQQSWCLSGSPASSMDGSPSCR